MRVESQRPEIRQFNTSAGPLRVYRGQNNEVLASAYYPRKDEKLLFSSGLPGTETDGSFYYEDNIQIDFFPRRYEVFGYQVPIGVKLNKIPVVWLMVDSYKGDIFGPEICLQKKICPKRDQEKVLAANNIDHTKLENGFNCLSVSFGAHQELMRYRVDKPGKTVFFKFPDHDQNIIAVSLLTANFNNALRNVMELKKGIEQGCLDQDDEWPDKARELIMGIRNNLIVVNPQIEV